MWSDLRRGLLLLSAALLGMAAPSLGAAQPAPPVEEAPPAEESPPGEAPPQVEVISGEEGAATPAPLGDPTPSPVVVPLLAAPDASSPLTDPSAGGAPGSTDRDRAADLEVSLTGYYQKYLGRARPNTQAYQQSFPWWTLFFGVWPVPVLPAEGEYISEAIRERIETGRFQVLEGGRGIPDAARLVGEHIEAVALARARIEAEQEGRYNIDLKGLDIYQHHLDAIRDAGYVYRMTLTDVAVLVDRGLSRWVAWARCQVELYQVIPGDPVRWESLGTLDVSGAGVAINVLQALDNSGGRRGELGSQLAALALPGVGAPAMVPLGLGSTLLGALGARGVAMTRAVRSMLDYLEVELSEIPGFRLEAPVVSVDGRRITFPMGTFEGLELDHAFDVWLVSPAQEGGCPPGMDEAPGPGACGKRVGYARVRDIADNTDPDGGRRTPEREAIKVQTGQQEQADLRPFDSEAQVLLRRGMPDSPLGLKVYEARSSGRGLVLMGGLTDTGAGLAGRGELVWRRSITDLIPISELSFDTALGFQLGGANLATAMIGLDKRLYAGRLGFALGGRVGLALTPDGCSGCRGVGGEVYGGLELLLSRHLSLQTNAVGQAIVSIDGEQNTYQSIGGLGGVAIVW